MLQRIDGKAGPTRRVTLAGTNGVAKQVRWTDDGGSVVFATETNLYIAPLDPAGDVASTTAEEIGFDDDVEIQDVRTMQGGLMVRAELPIEMHGPTSPLEFKPNDLVLGVGGPQIGFSIGHVAIEENLYLDDPDAGVTRPGQLYFVPLTDDGPGKPVALLGENERTYAAMPLSDGTVAVAVAPFDAGEYWDESSAEHLVIAKPSARGWTRISATTCADDCDATNWAPASDKPIFATSNRIVLGDVDGKEVVFDEDIGVLWQHPKTGSILVGAGETVSLLTADGEEKWRWETGEDDLWVRSAQFTGDDEAVIVATDKDVMRIVDGRAKRILHVKSYFRTDDNSEDEDDWSYSTSTSERRLDSVVPLPGGGIAYSILETETHEESL